MKKPRTTVVGPCELCGQYFTARVVTRPPRYCWLCGREAKRMANRDRQRAWRERQRAAKNPRQKRQSEATPLPVRGGGSLPTSDRGMYSGVPEPERTNKRRKVGLS